MPEFNKRQSERKTERSGLRRSTQEKTPDATHERATPDAQQAGPPTAVQRRLAASARSTRNARENNVSPADSLRRLTARRGLTIQTKLTVTAGGDRYEQEADAVASKIVERLQAPTAPQTKNRDVQRQAQEDEVLQAKPLSSTISRLRRREAEEVGLQMQRREADEEELQAKAAPIGREGGAVDAATEQSIRQARGNGQRMPTSVRRSMERAFGADFGNVRVHTGSQSDRLNRAISARAFTTGSDIFFRQGAYDPHSRSGQQLLAHELTHVVQQRTGPAGSLQRAIGMEFEINWQVYKRTGNAPGQGKQSLPKKTLLREGQGWNMETDGTDIEFVVDAVPEPDGIALLLNVLDDLTQFVGGMNNQKNTEYFGQPIPFIDKQNDPQLEVYTAKEDIAANPQATVGVALEKVNKLYQSLGDKDNNELEDLMGAKGGLNAYATKSQRAAARAVGNDPQWPGHQPSEKLKGLMTLLVEYLDQGSGRIVQATPTVKYLTYLMVRTDFATLFEALPDDEKTHYRNHPKQWVQYVCMLAGVPTDGLVFDVKVHDGLNLGHDDRIQIPIKRKDWLKKMTKGTDLLTEEANPIKDRKSRKQFEDTREGLGHRLRGLGGLGDKMDTVDLGRQGAILELRVMKQEIPYTEWTELGISVYDFIRRVNRRKTTSRAPKYRRRDVN
ncbi:MAG: DUF4157 domain-containing protein [Chloroflexota bacterium]